jgi:hypothetical protein
LILDCNDKEWAKARDRRRRREESRGKVNGTTPDMVWRLKVKGERLRGEGNPVPFL